MNEKIWHIYLVRTAKGHLYTGITTDVERRFHEHQAGKGAKYLRGKQPLQLVFQQTIGSHSDALKIEVAIKKMPKIQKEQLVRHKALPPANNTASKKEP